MNVFRTYTLATAGYLTVQSLPLLLTPALLVTLLSSEARRMTDLESYLSRALGLALLTLALLCILLSGTVPLTNQLHEEVARAQEDDAEGAIKDPYAYPLLTVTTIYHALGAFYLYTHVATGFSFGFGAGMIISTALFCIGLWVLLFGSDKGRISKSTGADKRTGNFPFENKESRAAKKESKESKESKRKSVSSKSR